MFQSADNLLTLSREELRTISLICDTFVPSLESPANSGFFRRSATSFRVDKEVARVIEEEFSENQRRQIRRILQLFESRAMNAILRLSVKKFSGMNSAQKERYLKKLAFSSLGLKRSAFQALKRLICFTAYGFIPENSEENPNWRAIGYAGRKPEPMPNSSFIAPIVPEQSQVFESDVVIAGSGAGGSAMAEYLSARWDVIVVESGGYYTNAEFSGQEYEMTSRLFEQHGRATTKDLSLSLLEGSALGGSTVVNWNTSIKPETWLRAHWEKEYGITKLTTNEFDECIEYAWENLKVNRDESQANKNNEALFRGCKALGYKMPEDYDIIWRNAVGCHERCTFCTYGCQYGCKQSTSNNLLLRAFQNGCKFIFGSTIETVRIESGRARGVNCVTKDGKRFEVRSSAVVLSAGSINTPAILLRSGLKKNVGTNLRLHPTTAIAGVFDFYPINMWEGPPQTCKVTKGLNGDETHHGHWIEAVPGHPALYAAAIPWTSGRRHKEIMLEMAHRTGTIILVSEHSSGRVSINKRGNPVCDYKMAEKDKESMMRGIVEGARILGAAGAKGIGTLHEDELNVGSSQERLSSSDIDQFESEVRKRGIEPNRISLFSAHLMGTARMGSDQSVSFCDDNAESYEVPGLFIGDASVFPSSPAINPMITIISMARRDAARIDSVLAKVNG